MGLISRLKSWCRENSSRQMPPLMMLPMTLAVTNEPRLDRAKFQLGTSFFSRKNERKNTESPRASMAAAWAMMISVHDCSGDSV